jgi:putative endonuclease
MDTGWYVYMLQCRDDSIYVGITTDIKRKVAQYNKGTTSKYTRSRQRPVRLIYLTGAYATKGEALKVERCLKQKRFVYKAGLAIIGYSSSLHNVPDGLTLFEVRDNKELEELEERMTKDPKLAARNGATDLYEVSK